MKITVQPNISTMLGVKPAQLTDFEHKCLEVIREKRSIGEETLLEVMFPRPMFPAIRSDANLEEWRTAEDGWREKAYGSISKSLPCAVKYQDTHCAAVSRAAIALRKAGYIRTTNNGYNCFTYHAV